MGFFYFIIGVIIGAFLIVLLPLFIATTSSLLLNEILPSSFAVSHIWYGRAPPSA